MEELFTRLVTVLENRQEPQRDAESDSQLGKNVKTPLPSFSGLDNEDPREFCKKAEEQLSGLHPSVWATTAGQWLKGAAAQWFTPYKNMTLDWAFFTNRLQERFNNELLVSSLESNLYGVDQKRGESVTSFILNKLGLAKRLYPEMSEQRIVQLILNRMCSEVKVHLQLHTFTSVEELTQKAVAVESLLRGSVNNNSNGTIQRNYHEDREPRRSNAGNYNKGGQRVDPPKNNHNEDRGPRRGNDGRNRGWDKGGQREDSSQQPRWRQEPIGASKSPENRNVGGNRPSEGRPVPSSGCSVCKGPHWARDCPKQRQTTANSNGKRYQQGEADTVGKRQRGLQGGSRGRLQGEGQAVNTLSVKERARPEGCAPTMVEGPPNEGRQDKSGRFVPGPPAGVKRGKIVEKQPRAGELKLEPPAGVKRRNEVLDQVGAGKLKPGSPTGVKRENRVTQNKAKGLSSGGSGGQNFENPIGLRSERLVGHTVSESQTEPSGLKSGGPASRVEVVEEQDRLEKPVLATQEPIGTRTDQQVEREVPGPQESGTVVPEAELKEDEKAARRQRLEKIIRRVGEASKMLRGMFSKRQLVVLDRLKPCEGGIPQSRKGALPERKNSFTAVLPTRKHDRAIVERNQRELRERELMCATGVFSVPRMGTGTGSVTGSRSRVDSGLVIQRAADVGGILCDGNPRPTIQPGADAGGILCDGNPQPTRCKAEPRCAQTLRGPCPASKGDAQQQQAEVVARQTQGGPCLAETTDARNQAQAEVKQTKGGPCFPGEAAADNQAEAAARQTKEGPCLAQTVEADREAEGEAEQTLRGPCSAKTLEANSRPMTDIEEFILTDPLGSGYRRKHAEATLKFSMKPISEGSSDTIAKQRRHQARTDAAIAEPNPKEPKERQPKCVTGTTGVSRSGTKAGGVTGSCSQGEGLLAGSQGSGPLRRTRTEAGNRYLMKPILKGGSNVIGDLHRKLPRIDVRIRDQRLRALVDSGSSLNLLRRSALADTHSVETDRGTSFQLACAGVGSSSTGTAEVVVLIEGVPYDVTVHVVEDLVEDLLLGCSWLTAHEAMVDFSRKTIYVGRKPRQTIFWSEAGCLPPEEYPVPEVTLEQLPERLAEEFRDLLEEFADVFYESPRQPITRAGEHQIRLRDDTPFKLRPYKVSDGKKLLIQEEVDKMLAAGVI
ncbi:uncharacterized protein [Leptinotarsa decemlineata]|uniref:uncharacterized protein n=1 Tax=Leptinotarsa decemlineata TaxID=7539 RepID=UPI003D30A563